MNESCDKLGLHFKYFAFIAFAVIIAVATERWSSSKEFTTYLSNAATMTSLLLGVVAIFYSFVSNDGMSRSLGSITTVTSEVREARQKIEQFVRLTEDATQVGAKSTALVNDASAKLSGSLVSFEETLRALSEQNETLRSLVSNLPTRIEQLETRVGDVAKALGEKPQQPAPAAASTEVPTIVVNTFLDRSTLGQNLFTYACVLAVEKRRRLSIPAFCTASELKIPSTLVGFLTCMHATQLCFRRPVDGEERTFSIASIHPQLVSRAKTYFVEYVAEHYSDDEQETWMRRLAAVEALFAA